MVSLAWCFLGRVGYAAGRDLQERLAAARGEGRVGDLVLALEHPPIVTVGRGWDASRDGAGDRVAVPGASWQRVGRGGGPTYHGPGQVVLYPVLALPARGRAVRPFVAALEHSLCDAAIACGVRATPRPGFPGAWIDAREGWRKLGSVGIGVRRGITLHGAALNVERRCEEGFRGFAPCGIAGARATSLESELGGAAPDLEAAAGAVVRALATRLGRDAPRAWSAGEVELAAASAPAPRAELRAGARTESAVAAWS